MKTLFNIINGIIENPKYQVSNGPSYFIIGASQYLNPRSDDSYLETIHIEYNPTLTDDEGLDQDEAFDNLYDAFLKVRGEVISTYRKEWGESDCHIEYLDNDVTVMTNTRSGLTLMVNGSDMGFYITVVHCLC